MFRSVRTKYMLAVMMVVVIAFMSLWLVISAIVEQYAKEKKEQLIKDKTVMIQLYLNEMLRDNANISLEQLLNHQNLDSLMRLITEDDNDISIVLIDWNGTVLLCSDRVNYATGDVLSSHLLKYLKSNEREVALELMQGEVFGEPKLVSTAILSVTSNQSYGSVPCGMVVLFSESADWEILMQIMTNAVLISTVIVLILALVMVSIVSMNITRPLKHMSDVVRTYAKGDFNARMPVHGNDEITQLAKAFNGMAESIGRLETLRNSFVANVSHDLRTPMTTISGFLDEIIEDVIPPEKQKHYLGVVLGEVRRLSRLVTSLLDISKMESGDRKFVMAPFDICEMGRQILISFEQKIEEKRLEVLFDCDEDRMIVNADRDAIYQIFYNICDNAIKFASEGGRFEIYLRSEKDRKVSIHVFNEGQGIPEEDLPFVFERFYKADKSRGLDKGGLGLGLYIAKTIITAHEEKIWVESEYGKNCEFIFTLPCN